MKEQITIIGLGLIGGSLARTLKAHGDNVVITGIDPYVEACELLSEAEAVDKTYPEITPEAVEQATIIIIATPPDSWAAIDETLKTLPLPNVRLIVDAGSVKRYANECFGGLPHFVACHPIAGSEFSGAAFSTEGLFTGKRVILTPEEHTPDADSMAAETFWRSVGMHPIRLDANMHDRIYAYVSHLPQLMAYAVAHATLEGAVASESYLKFLRLGGSSPALWVSIFQHNPYIAPAAEQLLHIIVHIMTELRSGELQAETTLNRERAQQLLPRIIASSLVSAVTMEENRSGIRMAAYAGSGFADMTHPAMTPPEEDLALISTHTNDVIALLSATESTLRAFLIALKNRQWDTLAHSFSKARNAYVHQLES